MIHDSKTQAGESQQPTRAVRLIFAGTQCLGLFAEEIEAIADWRTPTPLPEAPAGVLGVACIRGRMLTVLAAGVLLGEASVNGKIVALHGDEQIALAVQHVGEMVQVAPDSLQAAPAKTSPFLGVVVDGGRTISILDPKQLFPSAMRRRERRRRRF